MSILGRLLAILLISFVAMAPVLAGTAAPGKPACDMVGMQDHTGSAGMSSKALSAICKIQCQTPAMLPKPEQIVQEISLTLSFPAMVATGMPSRSNPPEGPPPRT